MKHVCLALVLMMVACSPGIMPEESAVPGTNETERLLEEGNQTTPDENASDSTVVEHTADKIGSQVRASGGNTSLTGVVVGVREDGEEPSITETYLELLKTKVKYYAFLYEYTKRDGTTGEVLIFRKDDWQVISGALWEVNLTTNSLEFIDDQRFVTVERYLQEKKDERDERTARDERENKSYVYNETHHLANYVWVNLTTGNTSACWIDTNRNQWNSEHCKSYENHSDRIVYGNLVLDRLLYLPEYWLVKFKGKAPERITERITYKDSRGLQTHVDRVEFITGINSEVVLYVHSGYGIPLKVEEKTGNNVVRKTTYLYTTINYPRTQRWYPDFLRP